MVESDILEKFPALEHNEDEFLNTNIFDWESEQGFNKVFEEKGGFDFIIGNPPYVEVKHYNVDLPYMHQYIKTRFSSSKNGKVDLAIPYRDWETDRKSTRLNSSHRSLSRMPSSA